MKLLVPSLKHFKSWTMLNRIGYVAAVIGIIAGSIQLTLWACSVYQWLEPAPSQLSVQDLLTIDQHPTELEIVGIEKKKYNANDEWVTFSLINNSSVTAKNVRVNFYNYNNVKYPYSHEFSNGYKGSGVDIRAGETRQYKIALVSDYEKFFNPDTPGEALIRVSADIQPKDPLELQKIVCGSSNEKVLPCTFSASGRSTMVDIRYGSIFGHKYHLLTQFYNDFLKGAVN